MRARFWAGSVGVLAAAMLVQTAPSAQAPAATPEVTFTKDIAPILQRSCQQMPQPRRRRADVADHLRGCAPLGARDASAHRGIGPHAGVMPPWFVEKNIGIQRFKGDPSLSDEEIAKVAKWVDSGAPRGNPADMPPATKPAA